MIVIFSGYNQRAVIAFLRTLVNNNIDQYVIIASGDSDTIFQTIYKKKVVYTRKKKQLDIIEICTALDLIRNKMVAATLFLIPSTEALNRFFLKNNQIFERYGCIIPLVNEELYIKISDKKSFWNICNNHNITVPSEINIETEYQIPMVAKPKTYYAANGHTYSPILIQSQQDFEDFINTYEKNDFTFQEFVNGESYYLLYYFAKNGKVFCLSQKNLAQQPGGKSIIAACCSNLHEDMNLRNQYETLLHNLGFHGLIMIELRKNHNQYYMIEANPRLWGPSQLFCDCGYNFFELLLNDYGFLNKVPSLNINWKSVYLWSGGAKGNFENSDFCIWHIGGRDFFNQHQKEFLKADIYNRIDSQDIFYSEY